MALRAPRGTQDILPVQAAAWQRLEATARRVFALYGYGEIRTPIFEHAQLFVKTTGETTDIVEKEMYTFSKGRDEYALRPEATPSVVRAYLHQRLDRSAPFQKYYYIGPMFRHERPQLGRSRQFSQLGVEALGSCSPLLDAEIVRLGVHLLDESGAKNASVRMNTLGCGECRPAYRGKLREFVSGRIERLCPDCLRRVDRNVFRVLDCKVPACNEALADAPRADQHLCDGCTGHFGAVCKSLGDLRCSFTVDPTLVRGLDYYTRTVFEYVHGDLGAQDAVGGGGRYDNLIEASGGKPLGAIGFAMGIERMLLASAAAEQAEDLRPAVCVVTVDDTARPWALAVADVIRCDGLSVDLDFEGRSLKSQMKRANRIGAAFVVIVGADEVAAAQAKLKDMETGQERTLPVKELPAAIRGHTATQPEQTE